MTANTPALNVKLLLSVNSPPTPAITTRLFVRSSIFTVLAVIPPFASILAENVETPVTIRSSRSVCPSTSKLPLASILPTKVDTPDTFKSSVQCVLYVKIY